MRRVPRTTRTPQLGVSAIHSHLPAAGGEQEPASPPETEVPQRGIVNELAARPDGPRLCRCPLCDQQPRPMKMLVYWSEPVVAGHCPDLIAAFAVCSSCHARHRTGTAILAAALEGARRRLLEWYPLLREKLPPDYQPTRHRTEG